MDPQIYHSILSGDSEVMVVLKAQDLREVVAGMVREERMRIDQALERKNEKATMGKQEAAAALGVQRSTLWRWEKQGLLVPVRIGAKVLYRASDIQDLLTKNQQRLAL